MAFWLSHLYGPRNLYQTCPSCEREVTVDELEVGDGVCRKCRTAAKKRKLEVNEQQKEQRRGG